MHEMLGELLDVVSVDTRVYVQRMSSVRVVDYNPSIGMIYAIGPPNMNSGNTAGHKNTRSGYFLVTHTSSTPWCFRTSMSLFSCSIVGVRLGALVR